MAEIASKRLPVTSQTWEALMNLKKHGETFDQLLEKMIAHEQCIRLHEELSHIEKTSGFFPLDESD